MKIRESPERAATERAVIVAAIMAPGDTSPVGHAADIHLDVSSWNFGIQEWAGFKQASLDVFPGCPELKKGYVYPNDKPGLGIEMDI